MNRELSEPTWSAAQVAFLFERIEKTRQTSQAIESVWSESALAYLYALTSLASFLTRAIRDHFIRQSWIEGFSAQDGELVGILLKRELVTLEDSRLIKQTLEFANLPARPLERMDLDGLFTIDLQLNAARKLFERLAE
ncbi:MAG: hypothetical protein EOP09_03650 [Proteobacteria bacterium]|nr:MAG: hypothetical protein EOP09_03650 [Pseudomonadota bacterium]